MKKAFLFGLVIALFLISGCQDNSNIATEAPTEACQHPQNAIVGDPKYESGQYCTDEVSIYSMCGICQEYILRGTMPSELDCRTQDGTGTIVREPTCTELGLAEGNCDKCGKSLQWDIPMIKHEYCWFYPDRAPSCAACGYVQETCLHDYAFIGQDGYSDQNPGKRYYRCKICNDSNTEVYDEFGVFQLDNVRESINMAAKDAGFTVVLDYNLIDGADVYSINDVIAYDKLNSSDAEHTLTKMGMDLLGQVIAYHSGADDLSQYYLTVKVEYQFSTMQGHLFNVAFEVRGATE